MDVFDAEKRSRIMASIKGKNTKPELVVRSVLFRMGYRFRLHRTDLPGKPDIVLPKFKAAIFVHGCFWHAHQVCPRSKKPETNREFWERKIDKNVRRDAENESRLLEMGWRSLIIWQCEIKDRASLMDKLRSFLV